MSDLIIGVGEAGVSSLKNGRIKTYALGSCVAVVIYDRVAKVGAMAHVALPDSGIDRNKAFQKPGYFADTAVPLLLREMKRRNRLMNRKHLEIKLAGGASVMDRNQFFNIGEKNIIASRAALRKEGLFPFMEDVGGEISRTVTLDINTGTLLLFNPLKGSWKF